MTSVASRFLSVDPHLKNACSSTVKFDISHRPGVAQALKFGRGRKQQSQDGGEDDDGVIMRTSSAKEWELDVRALISSKRWLQNYGLKKNRLQLNHILPSIGFKLSDEFDESLKRPISSRYGGGLFRQMLHPDGRTFNISCTKDKLSQLEKRLLQAMYLFRRRLEWLTTESRRTFGVIEERSVTIVLDIRNMSPQQFDQYRTALERVLREQISQISKFNLIRASEELELYRPECAPVSHDTIQNAIDWLWGLDRLAPVSPTAAAEGILRALSDQHNEAVYLFTEGTSVDSGKEILMDKIAGSKFKVPVHVVSFNCDCSSTITFLKQFAKASKGKFHAYGVVMELDAYEAQPNSDANRASANIMLKRKTFGGVPAGAGVREDVILIFEEVEEARNNLAQVRMLIERAPEPKRAPSGVDTEPSRPLLLKDEQYMSSQQWLRIYGLDARKLGLYDVLGGVAFKHLDGVIDIMQPPPADSQTDAIVHQKLINARYCDRFPVVKWKDGRVVHVQVTPDVHRTYEERVQVALNKIQQRIDWLNQGSRSLFGTLVEDMIYILIDTSASMQPSLGFVKQKLFVLMQEQLRHKKKFNLVSFNSKAAGWKDRLVDVSERSLQNAWSWVQNLSCWGTTNTYGAIQLAMADPQTEAIYLLTDGRPDQPPKSIIAQVQMQKHIPIHTISFNCNDSDANQFLYALAEGTSGRYHYFSESGPPIDQPDSWESMDIRILKDEMKKGLENLDKLTSLRDECTRMAWKRETDELRKSIDTARESARESGRKSAMPPLDSKDLYRPDSAMRPTSPLPPQTSTSSPVPNLSRPTSTTPTPTPVPRPSSAPPSRSVSVLSGTLIPSPPPGEKGDRPGSAHGSRVRGSDGLPVKLPKRPKSAKVSMRKPLVAGHTRTSMMRTLSSSGRFSPNEWLLPETKSLFQIQAERQKELAKQRSKQEQQRKKKTGKMAKANQMSSKQWLSKHGLVAKRLTILDALGSTFVPHKAKYVSILDKHVMSKVFDEVMPIAHVSKNQSIRLVNPNGVNLKEYETKVKAAQEKFKKRLDNLVWNGLTDSDKEEFDSDKPVSFEENQSKILRLLEEADWPVKQQDVTLLAEEIARADKFLTQSKALRKAAAGEDNLDSSEDNSIQPSKFTRADSPSSDTRPETPTAVENTSDNDNDDRSDDDDNGDDDVKKSNDKKESPRKDEDVKKSQSGEGLGQVLRSVDRTSKGKVKEKAEVIKSKVKVRLDTLRGQRVIARKDVDGLYYPAVVVKCPNPRQARVRYDGDGESQVLTRNIIAVGGAVARPPLYVGDYVLMRVVHLDNKEECYVPAVIQVEPQRNSAAQKFYSVIMYNGQKATTMRQYLVKISKERFELASMYIAEQQNEDREKAQELLYVSPRASNKGRKRRPDDTRKHERKRSPLSVSSQGSSDEIIHEDIEGEEAEEMKESSRKSRAKEKRKRYSHKSRKSSGSGSRSTSRSRSSSRSKSDSRSRSRSRSKSKDSSRLSSSQSSSRSRSRSNSRSGSSRSSSKSSRSSVSDRKEMTQKEVKDKDTDTLQKGEMDTFFDDDDVVDVDDVYEDRSPSPVKADDKEITEHKRNRRKGKKTDDEDEHGKSARSEHEPEKGSSRGRKNKELEKLQAKLLSQQKKQERMKKKLKRKAKLLSRRKRKMKKSLMKDLANNEHREDVVIPDPDDDSSNNPGLIELRQQLQHLRPGEEVLARWLDDGWYYRGIIRQYHGDYSYDVEDSTGFLERIWREDLFSENDAADRVFEIDHKVIALHPDYSFSYAPGTIASVNDSQLEVLFYDGCTGLLPWGEVYHYHRVKPLTPKSSNTDSKKSSSHVKSWVGRSVVENDDSKIHGADIFEEHTDGDGDQADEMAKKGTKSGGGSAKYRQDVAYIKEREEKLVGAAVVARLDKLGAYFPGTAKKRSSDNSRMYVIEWADGSRSNQDSIHIFSALTRRPNLSVGDRVLACVDPVHVKFLPGHLAGPGYDGKLVVKFCNSEIRQDVDPSLCYWLSQDYYTTAVKYFKSHDPSYR